ncbi:MsnO8 family LLM class oxidoreductase [Aerococcus urinaeequi]|uniref:MsnO8 family LLM class oxidoreductase n=1 Tax=Aerococcus urinaeequi TaxID=51665 RepID=UPI003AE771BA
MALSLSLLDQNIIYEGETAQSTLKKTVAFAQKAEALGYDSFVVAEHHFTKEIASAAPEILVGYILAKTDKIRVGSGGVMLQHYVPYKVAESFSLLHQLAPGRVILGLGKAQGGKDEAVEVLQRDFIKPVQSFNDKFIEVTRFIRNNFPTDHPYAAENYDLQPAISSDFTIELLGGSQESANLATTQDTGLVYPYFANADLEALGKTRAAYQGSGDFKIAIIVYITDDPDEGKAYLAEQAAYTVVLNSGKRVNFNKQAAAEEYADLHQAEDAKIVEEQVGAFVGTASQVKAQLDDFSKRFNTDHFVIHTIGIPYAKKFEIIEALAGEIKGG